MQPFGRRVGRYAEILKIRKRKNALTQSINALTDFWHFLKFVKTVKKSLRKKCEKMEEEERMSRQMKSNGLNCR